MSSEGEIRTCFISARLPSWAGVRQGVAGTNVNGGVVGAPAQSGVLAYSRFVQQQQQQPGTAATGSVFRAVFPSVDLSAEVGMMRQALAELRQQLQELREVVEIQLRATASEAAEEEEEEEIVVDEEVAPGAGANTMEEEEDEMVLTMTVVGDPEPAGVEAQPPPPPTPESDPAVPATTTTPKRLSYGASKRSGPCAEDN
ncbi:pIX [Porcine adenovirus 3]|uniref:PIX n=1 Tax=Porcine adenovirus A serotype 3 TaxID=35265 RepID=A0A9W4EC76_ADEP3|nr:IX [Porcine adenovirus 3]BAA76962.1 pIX [Porcine adenovirus 3]CAB41024.1 pIX [Porcine adenovirus 3]